MKIHFEDEYIVAVDKKAKQFVHPIPGIPESKDCLLFQVRDYLNQYTYHINRLDRPVSGITLFAKKPSVVSAFQEIWHFDKTIKKYLCLHRGILEKKGVFSSTLSKRGPYKFVDKETQQEAITIYNPLEVFKNEFCTHTEVQIKTGRYHQIRRHFRKAVMPIVGDRKHGKGVVNKHFEENYSLDQIFLHCNHNSFEHPITNKFINISSELPENLLNTLSSLRLNKV